MRLPLAHDAATDIRLRRSAGRAAPINASNAAHSSLAVTTAGDTTMAPISSFARGAARYASVSPMPRREHIRAAPGKCETKDASIFIASALRTLNSGIRSLSDWRRRYR